jgi:hypothetical protein
MQGSQSFACNRYTVDVYVMESNRRTECLPAMYDFAHAIKAVVSCKDFVEQVLDQSRSVSSNLPYIALLGTLARSSEPAVERIIYSNSMLPCLKL